MGGGFGQLADVIDDVREDPEVRAVVLQTRAMSGDEWHCADAWALEHAVLPVVAAWTAIQEGAGIAAGIFADIRTGDESTLLTGFEELDGRTGERMALLMRGQAPPAKMTAEEARNAGLVTAIEPGSGALAAAMRIAEAIAERGPIATQLAKEAIWRGLAMPLEQGLRFETDLTLLLQATKDREEGVRAFIEKRPPQFRGI
jgi:enoyl-CoA hydratase/carnithine racemase